MRPSDLARKVERATEAMRRLGDAAERAARAVNEMPGDEVIDKETERPGR